MSLKNKSYNEENDKVQKPNALEVLSNISERHSINESKARQKQNPSKDNSDGSYKIANFL